MATMCSLMFAPTDPLATRMALQNAGAVENYSSLNDLDGGGELQKEDRRTDLKSGGIPAEVVSIPPDRFLRPDLTIDEIDLKSAWRTFWYVVDPRH